MEPKLQIFLALFFAVGCYAHIRVWEPTARPTLWRDPRWDSFNPAVNLEDDGVYCGRIYQPWPVVECGVCGDPWALPTPRPHETGGTFARGIIVANYTQGQVFPFNADITIPHNGSFWIEACDQVPETEECFAAWPRMQITTADGTSGTEIPVNMTRFVVDADVQLPMGLSGRQVVLRVTYRSGFMGDCGDGTNDYGCGPQQHFRSCIDVGIAL
jgi:hypothetical protein